MFARSYRVLDGNKNVIHHWLFYKNIAAVADGQVGFSTGAHPDGELVHGWAPGGSNLYFDPDVGVEMPGDVGYTLETHHNNTGTGAAPDNSGIEVCVTPTVPKNVASLSWLGTDAISGTTATGTCEPTSTEPIHIIGVQPHMHTKGIHMTGEITRASGKKEMLHDAPFDFQYQHSYDANTILMPGDSIKTTCTYNAPTSFGEGTNDEMCYLFTLYYPKLSLTNGNPVATLIHGPNTCLQ
jgi:Copper type II ascorbate-dependent monooxygenase, C-terminal domain